MSRATLSDRGGSTRRNSLAWRSPWLAIATRKKRCGCGGFQSRPAHWIGPRQVVKTRRVCQASRTAGVLAKSRQTWRDVQLCIRIDWLAMAHHPGLFLAHPTNFAVPLNRNEKMSPPPRTAAATRGLSVLLCVFLFPVEGVVSCAGGVRGDGAIGLAGLSRAVAAEDEKEEAEPTPAIDALRASGQQQGRRHRGQRSARRRPRAAEAVSDKADKKRDKKPPKEELQAALKDRPPPLGPPASPRPAWRR